MVLPIGQGDFDVYHGEGCKWPLDHHILKAFLASRDVFCGNGTTEDAVDEFEGLFAIIWKRLNLSTNTGILTRTTRLLFV